MVANKKSDSDYNFTDDESSADNEPFRSPTLNKGHAPNLLYSPDNQLLEYRKSAEMWTVQQLTEEINTINQEINEIKWKSPDIDEEEKSQKNKSKGFRFAKRKKRNTHCFCKGKYSQSAPMVQCDWCDVWYHQICVGLDQSKCDKLPSFCCKDCKDEKLKDLDRKTFINSTKIMKDEKKMRNFGIRHFIRQNEAIYYKSKENFIKLFESDPNLKSFCLKAIDLEPSEIRLKILDFEAKIRKLRSKGLLVKKKKTKFNRSNSLELSPKRLQISIGYDSDGVVGNSKIKKVWINKSKLKKKKKIIQKKATKSKKVQPAKEKRNEKMVRKVKDLMAKFKLSQKFVSKDAKLTGGATTLSSWLNDNYVFNLPEKEGQIAQWLKRYTAENVEATPRKKRHFSVDEKVDFFVKKKWVEGRILKASNGQYLVSFKLDGESRKKWVASLAKRIVKFNTKRKKSNEIKKGKKVRKIVK